MLSAQKHRIFPELRKADTRKAIREFVCPTDQQIADDLRCTFVISEMTSVGDLVYAYKLRTDCNKVSWIRDCIANAFLAK